MKSLFHKVQPMHAMWSHSCLPRQLALIQLMVWKVCDTLLCNFNQAFYGFDGGIFNGSELIYCFVLLEILYFSNSYICIAFVKYSKLLLLNITYNDMMSYI